MTAARKLKLVEPERERVGAPDAALRILLRDRDRATREIAEIDEQMLAYRKSYARERGEFMLPTLARLRRELLA
jgi:hypothetical protein